MGSQAWKASEGNPFSVLQEPPVEFAMSLMKIVILGENRKGRAHDRE
jgi:hypothetical protein